MLHCTVFVLLLISTQLQADTQADEPNTECFSSSLKAEIRQLLRDEMRQLFQMQENLFPNLADSNLNGSTILNAIDKIMAIKDDLRQELVSVQADLHKELGLVQAAVRADQAEMETNIVRRLNETMLCEDTLGRQIMETNAYLRDIHPWVQSQLGACYSNPCQNGGTCTPGANGTYSCSCGSESIGVNCETRAEWITREGHSYFVSDTRCNYYDCRTKCQELGADLITIESPEEQRFAASIAINYFWLSIIYETMGTVSGRWVIKQASSQQITFSNWAIGEPERTRERCAVAYSSWGYQWGVASCNTDKNYYICEK